MMKAKSNDFLGWLLLIILSVIWGSSFILIKKGLANFSAMEVGALRIFSAGVFLIPFALKNINAVKTRQAWLVIFFVGLCGSLLPSFLFALAQTQLGSAVTGILNALTPFMTLVIGAIVFRLSISKHNLIGISIGFLGTVVLIVGGAGGSLGNINYFVVLVIFATICYGFNLNLIHRYLSDINAVAITSMSLVLVLPVSGYLLFNDGQFLDKIDGSPTVYWSLFFVILLGVIGTAVALILFNRLVQLKDPVFASSVTYLIPIIAIIWGLLDGEVLLAGHYLGIVIIIVGIYIANRKSKGN